MAYTPDPSPKNKGQSQLAPRYVGNNLRTYISEIKSPTADGLSLNLHFESTHFSQIAKIIRLVLKISRKINSLGY